MLFRSMQSEFLVIADALAPGIIFAQAIGRFGNWFNGELFGKPSTLPWALEIPLEKRPITFSSFETFHPTFLYEALWCVVIGFILLQITPKRSGQIFWLYVSLYSIGRVLIESIRIDYSNLILGARLNVWVAAICAAVGVWQYLKSSPKKIG